MKKNITTALVSLAIVLIGVTSGTTLANKITPENGQTIVQGDYIDNRDSNTPSKQTVLVGNYHDYMVIICSVTKSDYFLDDSDSSPYLKDGKVIFEEGELVQFIIDENNNVLTVRKIRMDIES